MRTVAPVSPGEMLDDEFLKPLVSASTDSPRTSVSPLNASATSWPASAPSRPIPICGSAATLASATDGGFAARWRTTRPLPRKPCEASCRASGGARCCRRESATHRAPLSPEWQMLVGAGRCALRRVCSAERCPLVGADFHVVYCGSTSLRQLLEQGVKLP